MEEKVTKLVERLWNDIAGLPWQDPSWFQSQEARDSAKQHFVTATSYDILKVINEEEE